MTRGSPDAVGFAPPPTQENNLIGTVTLPLNNVGLFLYRDRSRILHQLFHIKWLKIYRKCSTRCSFLICCLSEISSTGCLAFFCKESLLLFSSGSVEVCAGAGGPLPPPAKPQKPLKDTTTRLGTQQKYNKEI